MPDRFNFGGGGLAGRHLTYEWWADDDNDNRPPATIHTRPEGYEGDWAMDWISEYYHNLPDIDSNIPK